METFTFQPDANAEVSKAPDLATATFGDGYEQIRPRGLNHNLKRYTLVFSGTEQRVKQIDDFLDRHGGYKSFMWKPYGSNSSAKFKCKEWKITLNTGFFRLSAEFVESVT